MKKNKLLLLLALALAALAAWLIFKKDPSNTLSTREMDYNFTLPDTAQITRIVIQDKTPCRVELVRTAAGWTANGTPARTDATETLLTTLKRMEMRNFIRDAERATIIANMAVYGKEVEVYAGDVLLKHFFVGTETPDFLGTYMMISGSDAPYAVHIPGFNGYLSSRFFCTPELWMTRVMFGADPQAIDRVEVVYRDSTGGFVLERKPDGRYVVQPQNAPPFQPEGTALNFFLSAFKTLQYEGVIVPTDGIWKRQDSLKASKPAFTLKLTSGGTTNILTAYSIVENPDEEELGIENDSPFDPDRFHAYYNDRFVLTQRFALRRVLVTGRYFTTPPPEALAAENAL